MKTGFYVKFFTFFYIRKFLYVLKLPVIATQPFEINCFAIATEGFKQFEYGTTGYFNINLSVIMTSVLLMVLLRLDIVLKNDIITLIFLFARYLFVMNVLL